ncbi:hypothetical protein [Vreelandella aquamarina]|uniref:hypothetical protein n=1 Tax=Vreelandella aquamarina TaxID=77097 RepID=UPI003850DE03
MLIYECAFFISAKIEMCEIAGKRLGLIHTYFSKEENMPSTTTIVVIVVVIAVAIFGFSGGLPF